MDDLENLEPRDKFCVRAAVGWLELGNADEAAAELEQLSEAARQMPDVLEVQWQIQAVRGDWKRALQVAEDLVARAPDRETGWLHRAYAMRRAPGGGLERAREALLPAAGRFPKNALIPYNLACYAAQLGQLDEAWDWFRKALRIGGRRVIKPMALADEDLEPLWGRIREL